MKIISNSMILVIKFYKYFISPYFPSNCRYLSTCSDYFIEAIKLNGSFKGFFLGTKRIFKCHPMKFLGGSSGLDFVPRRKKRGGE